MRETVPSPARQISASRRPASRPPCAATPQSRRRAPPGSSVAETPRSAASPASASARRAARRFRPRSMRRDLSARDRGGDAEGEVTAPRRTTRRDCARGSARPGPGDGRRSSGWRPPGRGPAFSSSVSANTVGPQELCPTPCAPRASACSVTSQPASGREAAALVRGEVLADDRLDLGDRVAERPDVVGQRRGRDLHQREPANAPDPLGGHRREVRNACRSAVPTAPARRAAWPGRNASRRAGRAGR